MSEILIPPWIIPEEEPQEPLDEGSSVFSSAFAPGLAQRQSYGGLRLKLSRRHTVRLDEKAQLLSVLRSTRGRYNAVRSKVYFALRGSFPATELLTNNTFASGTTGWSVGSQGSIAVMDRILRSTRIAVINTQNLLSQTPAVTQYAPHVLRVFSSGGKYSVSLRVAIYNSALTQLLAASANSTNFGVFTTAAVPYETSITLQFEDVAFDGLLSNDYVDVPYISLSRCPIVDNGPNLLLQSDEFDATWSAFHASVDDQARSAPDGSTTADDLIENSDTNGHGVFQAVTVTSAAVDYAFTCAIKAGDRTWALLQMEESTGSQAARAWINLSTGALGTVTTTGANWANLRAFVRPLGNGWYALTLVARKTSVATTVTGYVFSSTGDSVSIYTGNGTSFITVWRATLAQSSLPTRLVLTTSAATSGTSQTGTTLHIKGLPASTNGLLLPEDVFEINGELKTCTAALNSDAAGLGYLQFEPALFRSPADNDPVIILDPMGKFLMSNLKIENEFGTQAKVSYDLEHIYE